MSMIYVRESVDLTPKPATFSGRFSLVARDLNPGRRRPNCTVRLTVRSEWVPVLLS